MHLFFRLLTASAIVISSASAFAETGDSRITDRGAEILLARAERGDTETKLSVALSYAQGKKGFPQDAETAMKWFLAAAEDGNAYAQNFAASAYAKGEGTPKDAKLAAHWWTKAADAGYPEAMFNLATCYSNGFGVEKNYKTAVDLWVKAADHGHPAAQFNVAVLHINGSYLKKSLKDGLF